MNRVKFTQIVCSLFPPVISQRIREIIYPRKLAFRKNIEFSRKSITGSYFESDSRDFHGYPFLFHGFFDWRNIIIANSVFKKNKGDIIEIGANIGTETVSFCDITMQKGQVHAFEPYPKNFQLLTKLRDNTKNLNLHQNAISDVKSTLSFQIPPVTSSGTGKIVSNSETRDDGIIKVEALPLDNFFDTFNKVQLISIDTEGHEPHVLMGSERTISEHRPTVIIEVSPKLLAKYSNSDPANIFNFFRNKNYDIYKINRFTVSEINQEDLNSNQPSNWICIPFENKKLIIRIKIDLLLRVLIPWYLLRSLPSSN